MYIYLVLIIELHWIYHVILGVLYLGVADVKEAGSLFFFLLLYTTPVHIASYRVHNFFLRCGTVWDLQKIIFYL